MSIVRTIVIAGAAFDIVSVEALPLLRLARGSTCRMTNVALTNNAETTNNEAITRDGAMSITVMSASPALPEHLPPALPDDVFPPSPGDPLPIDVTGSVRMNLFTEAVALRLRNWRAQALGI